MEFHRKLPRSRPEFALFMAIVSIVSVNIIAPLITCFEVGFHLAVWADAIAILPLVWVCVVAFVLITYKPAEWLTAKIVAEADSFRSHIIVNTLCTVFLMSIFLTVFGTWIGSRQFNLEPIRMFFFKWPRNFAISFAVELCVAQPLARAVLYRLHLHNDRKANAVPRDLEDQQL